MKRLLSFIAFLILQSSFFCSKAYASHLLGADIYYTHVTGNTYSIVLDVYGDCSGSAFPNFSVSTPEIEIYNNTTLVNTINLSLSGPAVEVTPVCPLQVNNTTCNNGTLPGVKKFHYTGSVNLGGISANWRFRFTGTMGGGSNSAGRSNSITNIVVGGPTPSIMVLEATLNNMAAPNSSVVYTTIPTPFFCINKPQQYNPGSVDANNDSLNFTLTPGLIPTGIVTYIAPYTAVLPLATTIGTFSFSNLTGQLNFTPNLVQNALVVGKVEEYRSGVLVGTSMREMTFVVLNNCNNNSPTGTVSGVAGGVSVNGNTIRACADQGLVSFNINPADIDGDNITISYAGLPTGATLTITGNGTAAPVVSFAWNITGVATGSYTFFITYTDNGCPLSSNQTVAYTINITPRPGFTYTQTQAATCVKKGVFQLVFSGVAPFTLTILQGSTTIHSFNNLIASQTDSLVPGTYTIHVVDINGCNRDSVITIAAPPQLFSTVTFTNPNCYNSSNGSITVTGSGGLPSYQYAIGSGTFSAANTFNNLAVGTYVIHTRDANFCIKDTTVTLQQPAQIIPSAFVQKSVCATLGNGAVTLTATGGTGPYQYALGAGAYSVNNVFSPLAAGTYIFHVKDNNGCTRDTTISLSDSMIVSTTIAITNALCINQNSGSVTLNGTGGISPYTYSLGTQAYGTANVFNNLAAGNFVFHIKDVNGCIKDTNAQITQPTAIIPSVNIILPLCNGQTNGSLSISGSGGTPAYTYAIGTSAYGAAAVFNNLASGNYTLHIKDANGCIKDTTVNINQPSSLGISLSITGVKCFGESSGSVTVAGIGGTNPFTYAADANAYQLGNILTGLNAGPHTIHVKDNNGCIKDTNITVPQPAPLFFQGATITDPTCEGFADGSVTLHVTGGTSPYQFSGDNNVFISSASFNQLTEGSYTFYLLDANGCTHDTSITLKGYPHIIFDAISLVPVSCFGYADGAITVNASGGNPPLTLLADNKIPDSSNTFLHVAAGNHTVEITDVTGCKKDTIVNVPTPEKMVINMIVTNNDCEGLDNGGAIKAEISGGNSPFVYAWTTIPQQNTETATGLMNGAYSVVVTDARNCIDSAGAKVVYDNCCTVFVPNAFTPNNDGRNDKVKVLFKGEMRLQQFSIYNRFGQRVFYGVNINDGWDGRFNGEPQDVGTYFYYLTVTCGKQIPRQQFFKGDLILVR